jgi:hypothetical protein
MSLVLHLVTVGLARYVISAFTNLFSPYRNVFGGTIGQTDIFNFPN